MSEPSDRLFTGFQVVTFLVVMIGFAVFMVHVKDVVETNKMRKIANEEIAKRLDSTRSASQ